MPGGECFFLPAILASSGIWGLMGEDIRITFI